LTPAVTLTKAASMTELFTIGFTRKAAERFFTILREAGVRTLIDVRLNNVSQLAGFSKRDDLAYFLREIAGIDYLHLTELAPTAEMLEAYKKKQSPWSVYEQRFLDLMSARRIEQTLSREMFQKSCLLCSEHQPRHCHRRLVAEYLAQHWGDVTPRHLE
jgi:uncharacterized protein (DUF488 family)